MRTSLLFIHGNSCSREYFFYQKNSDLLNDYDLHFINLIGHGKNNEIPKGFSYSLNDQSRAISDYIAKNNLNNVILIGHSLGGHIALRVKFIDVDNKISGLFLYGTAPLTSELRFDLAFHPIEELSLLFTETWTLDQVELVSSGLFANCNAKDRIMLKEILLASDGHARYQLAKEIKDSNGFDEVEFLKLLKIPFQILICKNDIFVNYEYLKSTIENNCFDYLLTTFSHSPHVEHPEEFNTYVKNFVERVENKMIDSK